LPIRRMIAVVGNSGLSPGGQAHVRRRTQWKLIKHPARLGRNRYGARTGPSHACTPPATFSMRGLAGRWRRRGSRSGSRTGPPPSSWSGVGEAPVVGLVPAPRSRVWLDPGVARASRGRGRYRDESRVLGRRRSSKRCRGTSFLASSRFTNGDRHVSAVASTRHPTRRTRRPPPSTGRPARGPRIRSDMGPPDLILGLNGPGRAGPAPLPVPGAFPGTSGGTQPETPPGPRRRRMLYASVNTRGDAWKKISRCAQNRMNATGGTTRPRCRSRTLSSRQRAAHDRQRLRGPPARWPQVEGVGQPERSAPAPNLTTSPTPIRHHSPKQGTKARRQRITTMGTSAKTSDRATARHSTARSTLVRKSPLTELSQRRRT